MPGKSGRWIFFLPFSFSTSFSQRSPGCDAAGCPCHLTNHQQDRSILACRKKIHQGAIDFINCSAKSWTAHSLPPQMCICHEGWGCDLRKLFFLTWMQPSETMGYSMSSQQQCPLIKGFYKWDGLGTRVRPTSTYTCHPKCNEDLTLSFSCSLPIKMTSRIFK